MGKKSAEQEAPEGDQGEQKFSQEQLRYILTIVSPNIVSDFLFNNFILVSPADFLPDDKKRYALHGRAIEIEVDGVKTVLSETGLVAKMINMLQLDGTGTVLSIGTGTGFADAVMSLCAEKVISIDRYSELVERAKRVFSEKGYPNIEVFTGDGVLGNPEHGPYKAIIVTACLKAFPDALLEQLATDDSTLLFPLAIDDYENAVLVLVRIHNGQITSRQVGNVTFMPLISNEPGGWTEAEVQKLHAEKSAQHLSRREVDLDLLTQLAESFGKTLEEFRNWYAGILVPLGADAHALSEEELDTQMLQFAHIQGWI